MGMAAGLLLSLVFWPSSPQPPKAPQGPVSRKLPPEPFLVKEPALSPEPQPQATHSPQSEPSLEVPAKEVSLPWANLQEPVSEKPPPAEPLVQGQEQAKESIPRQERVAPSSAARGTRAGKPTGVKNSFSFTLHVESFKSAEAAARRVEVLKEQGLDAFSQPAQVPGKGLFHRVFVGKFQDRASARKFLEKLKAEEKLQQGRVLARSEMER